MTVIQPTTAEQLVEQITANAEEVVHTGYADENGQFEECLDDCPGCQMIRETVALTLRAVAGLDDRSSSRLLDLADDLEV